MKTTRLLIVSALLLLNISTQTTGAVENSILFPDKWIDGTDTNEPPIQIHRLAPGAWILRQSLLTHYEGPFLYLFVGTNTALLWDTGAKARISLRSLVDELISAKLPLVVLHSHAHDDHTAGDSQFQDRPNTRIVGANPKALAEILGLEKWPESKATCDLGGRILDIIAIPGHEPAHIALYDQRTRVLLTGDTLYPGRLYIQDQQQYRASIRRLIDFSEAHPVSWILGNHIEMQRNPGVDYPRRAPAHPHERPLQMTVADLRELHTALKKTTGELKYEVHDNFIIVPGE